jgi:HB1/ASXL restriction endonuclease-like protein with HTH domain
MNWRDSIIEVLRDRAEPMHYTEIADAIAQKRLRAKLGATPAQTVNATISTSIKDEAEASPFVRSGKGYCGLRGRAGEQKEGPEKSVSNESVNPGLIHAFGMYWARSRVDWTRSTPKILGIQQPGSSPVDFCTERGVYLLHDVRSVVYVGRTTDQPLGIRLRQHTSDRLTGRWDRFSWFGVDRVTEAGDLIPNAETPSVELLIATMEALLIEGLEPPQNRKRGDDFKAIEFLQVDDPAIKTDKELEILDRMRREILKTKE